MRLILFDLALYMRGEHILKILHHENKPKDGKTPSTVTVPHHNR